MFISQDKEGNIMNGISYSLNSMYVAFIAIIITHIKPYILKIVGFRIVSNLSA